MFKHVAIYPLDPYDPFLKDFRFLWAGDTHSVFEFESGKKCIHAFYFEDTPGIALTVLYDTGTHKIMGSNSCFADEWSFCKHFAYAQMLVKA